MEPQVRGHPRMPKATRSWKKQNGPATPAFHTSGLQDRRVPLYRVKLPAWGSPPLVSAQDPFQDPPRTPKSSGLKFLLHSGFVLAHYKPPTHRQYRCFSNSFLFLAGLEFELRASLFNT
jgi:hypothetical protein